MKPKCGFCDKEATKDGITTLRHWAYMCDEHFKEYGINKKGCFTTLQNIGKPNREIYSD